MFRGLFGYQRDMVAWQRKHNRELPIEVLGRLGWTVDEVAGALGVSPPTVRATVAYLVVWNEGKFGHGKTSWPTKLSATIRELALRENTCFPSGDNDRVVSALRNVLANVPRLPPVE